MEPIYRSSLGQLDSTSKRAASSFRLIPAAFTPFNDDGSLDRDAVARYADYLHRHGICEVFVNGTTGEGLSLTVDERLAMVEAWLEYRDQIESIVHVGHNCQRECIRMAAHAGQMGIRSVSAMSPCFFRPNDERTMVDFLVPIAAAAPDARFYFYHMPSMTGMLLDMAKFIPMALERIPNFGGVKYTHEDIAEFKACLRQWGSQIELFFGRDELLLEALAVGARGAVGSFYSLIPDLFQQIIARHFAGDSQEARKLADASIHYIETAVNTAPLVAPKFLLSELGVMGSKVRPPLTTLDATVGRRLLEQLADLGSPT